MQVVKDLTVVWECLVCTNLGGISVLIQLNCGDITPIWGLKVSVMLWWTSVFDSDVRFY